MLFKPKCSAVGHESVEATCVDSNDKPWCHACVVRITEEVQYGGPVPTFTSLYAPRMAYLRELENAKVVGMHDPEMGAALVHRATQNYFGHLKDPELRNAYEVVNKSY